jgi:hypothetical protein
MQAALSASALTDQLALLIVVALVVLVLIRLRHIGSSDVTIIVICFGSPLAVGIYYVLKRLFRASNRRVARARVAGHNECASIWRPNSRNSRTTSRSPGIW